MSFWHIDHQICWHSISGDKSPSLHLSARGDLIDALLENIERTSSSIHPQGLPPVRSHDYHICLLSTATSVAVCPYRYASAHKDELEC